MALFLLIPGAAFAGTQGKNISYGAMSGQTLDIYTPAKQTQNAPVMIFVHGGAWAIGDKKRVQSKPEAFNNAGYIFISMNYPLVPNATVEQQAQSVADAVRWTRQNIKRYGGDPSSIALMGHSAGGHLVALVGADQSYLRKAGLGPDAVKAVVPIDAGSLNVPQSMTTLVNMPEKIAKMFLAAFGSNPVRWAKLSPIHNIKTGRSYPPFLCLPEATRKDSVTQCAAMTDQLKAVGGIAETTPIEDRTHATINKKFGEDGDIAFQRTLEFLSGLK